MENLELIKTIEGAALQVLAEMYGNKDLYCEIVNVDYTYCEGDYDDPIVDVKIRCGRYNGETEAKELYNIAYDIELHDVGSRSRDYIAGMIYTKMEDF